MLAFSANTRYNDPEDRGAGLISNVAAGEKAPHAKGSPAEIRTGFFRYGLERDRICRGLSQKIVESYRMLKNGPRPLSGDAVWTAGAAVLFVFQMPEAFPERRVFLS